MEFFESPNHIAYWGFSLAIGILQQVEYTSSGTLKNTFILVEHLVRTNILLVAYWIFETSQELGVTSFDSQYMSFQGFFSDHSHQYIAIVLFLLGLVIGFANITATNYLSMLRDTARKLRKYSEWFFGRELLSQAVIDSSVLTLQRRERTILFMDIRGFTSWSETKTPEEVVTMLNAYFETAEKLWTHSAKVIKVKHTADEIMAVFLTAENAIYTALQLCEGISNFLNTYGLSAGIGIHCGQLVEGLIGSTDVKTYDIIGDTVNTGKRICDKAAGGEILISQECYTKLSDVIHVFEPKLIDAKGKSEALQVYPVQGLVEE
jgi:class 3 adenylate cyclase